MFGHLVASESRHRRSSLRLLPLFCLLRDTLQYILFGKAGWASKLVPLSSNPWDSTTEAFQFF